MCANRERKKESEEVCTEIMHSYSLHLCNPYHTGITSKRNKSCKKELRFNEMLEENSNEFRKYRAYASM